VRFEKNGPDPSSETKVMAVLSLDSVLGFLARCWKGGGSILWIGTVVEIRSVLKVNFVGSKWMERIKLNQNKSKPATKLNLEHELRTTDSKTELCKG
jgi:hypothetical protein